MKYSILVVFLLSGCSWASLTRTELVETVIYPELPPVPVVGQLNLLPCVYDRPRIWWEPLVVKSNSICKKRLKDNPELSKDKRFQRDCMEYDIDVNSNITIGLDSEGQKCYTLNTEKIRSQLRIYQSRIKEINKQREVWIKRNEDSRTR